MEVNNLLDAKNRDEFRAWLEDNHMVESECWAVVKRGRPLGGDTFWYVDAVLKALQSDGEVWANFQKFPDLYKRVRIDTIQIKKKIPALFQSRLEKFIYNTRRGIMYGEWNDGGRLL